VFRAYAKINLGLLVLRRRPDGFHDIATVFHRIDLFDELELAASDRVTLASDDPAIPTDERNLCVRAALLLKEHLGISRGVDIRLTKRIPAGAGLGGGSSDAAVVLKHLPPLWGADIRKETLAGLALRLGSDVPYFLSTGSAFALGRGEILEPIDLRVPYTILLCNPGIHVSTAWAYAHVTLSAGADPGILKRLLHGTLPSPGELARGLRNDFEECVFREYPGVGALKRTMIDGGAIFASMSGSGSSVYGFFDDPTRAGGVAEQLRKKGFVVSLTAPNFRPSPDDTSEP
jgi:4-diphosphocytidyl-2-C-methyl-D-erythritol kinase